MDKSKTIIPPLKKAWGDVHLQGSKSIANRVLPVAAVGRGAISIQNLPSGEDVSIMKQALGKLGVRLTEDDSTVQITGNQGPFSVRKKVSLNLGNSGTTTRFLTALVSAGQGIFEIDGIPRLRERPIGDLVDAIHLLSKPVSSSTRIEYLNNQGYPPLRITANGLPGGETKIRGDLSSQFLSGLLMSMPLCQCPVKVIVEGNLVSQPYIKLTMDIMQQFSVALEHANYREFSLTLPEGFHNPVSYTVEADASSASYFLAAGAIAGNPVTVHGIGNRTLQFGGEGGFAQVLQKMGAKVTINPFSITVSSAQLQGIDINMDHMTDTGMTLAVLSLFAQGKTHISGIGNWRLKETDRISAMASQLRKLGAEVDEGKNSLSIIPPTDWKPAEIETFNDHRMAMSFSLAAFSGNPVTILNPQCVNKTFPDYFKVFSDITFP